MLVVHGEELYPQALADRYVTHDGSGVYRTFVDEEVDLNESARIVAQWSLEKEAAKIEVLDVRNIFTAAAIPKCVHGVVRINARCCSACINYIL